MDHKELWLKIFGDTPKYADFYFKEKAKNSIVYSKYDDQDLVSMAFFTPYDVVFRGRECRCPYVVGVATSPEYRHRGYMKMLLEQGLMDSKLQGMKLAFLCPADENIYKPLGFESVCYQKHIEVTGHQTKWYSVGSFSHMDAATKHGAAEFANAQLYASDLDLYIKRSVHYYDTLYKEAKALGGKVLVVREGAIVRGVAVYIHESDEYEVTEVICDPADGLKVMESVCAYIGEDKTKKIEIDDTYFLRDVVGEGITVHQMEKPHMMVKALQWDVDIHGLRVYINDLT